MHVPALCVAYWISRHCVLMYGKYGLLTKFFFCVFIDRDEVEVYKLAKKERGQYPAILTSHLVNNPYILTDLLYMAFGVTLLAGYSG